MARLDLPEEANCHPQGVRVDRQHADRVCEVDTRRALGVSAVDLIRGDAEALVGDAAKER